jgi:tRNA(Leu) C34 or U34 (ribose-2'-O)-methylase TrmL
MPEGTKIVCVELVEGAIPLPEYQHPENALYVFGPEDGNLKQSIVNQADEVVYIPTVGCMNLAATVNVLLYDRLAKTNNVEGSDQLIRDSRDNNNHLKVKK